MLSRLNFDQKIILTTVSRNSLWVIPLGTELALSLEELEKGLLSDDRKATDEYERHREANRNIATTCINEKDFKAVTIMLGEQKFWSWMT